MAKTTFKGSIMLNPVPAVLITSRNLEGKDNVFTVGWIGTACTKPPMITVAIRPERLSHEYIKEGNSFVVNLASTSLVKAVDYCGVRGGKTTDKFKDMNLTLSEAEEINCGVINECPVAFECVVKSITPLGSHDLFLAEVVKCHVDEELIDEKGKIHFDKADLLAYSHGEYFGINPVPLGSFGYSVRKKPSVKKTITSTEKSSLKVNENIENTSRDKKSIPSKNTYKKKPKQAKAKIDTSKRKNTSSKSTKANKSKPKKRTRI